MGTADGFAVPSDSDGEAVDGVDEAEGEGGRVNEGAGEEVAGDEGAGDEGALEGGVADGVAVGAIDCKPVIAVA